ncbi:50S ribosomal protein L23 [Patescibacteria group bacterium]|nr:50S ribosomal protein L23 [Patescibacteria group bacterium]
MALLKKKPKIKTFSLPKKITKAPAVLLLPQVSEKATRLQSQGQYSFKVKPGVSKIVVKKAIESAHGVRVIAVNARNLPRKTVRRGRNIGQTRIRRIMTVRLAPGQTLQTTKSI